MLRKKIIFTGTFYKKIFNKFRTSWKSVLAFCVYGLIFGIVTTPFMVLYGPFDTVKKVIVSSSIESMRFQFIAKTFLSTSAIARIMDYNIWVDPALSTIGMDNVGTVDYSKLDSSEIEQFDISGPGFIGKALIIHDPTTVAIGYSATMPRSGQTTSAIAKRFNAIAAINGGGFVDTMGYTGNGGEPDGFVISKGEVIFNNLSKLDKVSVAAINGKGQLIVGYYNLSQLQEMDVREAINFSPPLLINGVKQDPMFYGTAPRTAIGQKKTGEIIFLVTEGRRLNKLGATNAQIQDVMLGLGAYNACNLDGGSSSTMVLRGSLITKVSDALGERSIPTAFLVLPESWETNK